jgi:hypothetical protein
MSIDNLKLEMEMEAFRASATADIGNGVGIWKGGSNPSRWGWQAARWRMKKGGVDIENIYETCIKPYAIEGTTVLDMGTNGGFWLSKMLDNGVETAIGLDVLSPDHLGFWKNLYHWHGEELLYSKPPKVGFVQARDFSLRGINSQSLDYVFSYDVFCHISWLGAQQYIQSLSTKMKYGADAFIMIANKEKYPFTRKTNDAEKTWGDSLAQTARLSDYEAVVADRTGEHSKFPGRWYFYGVDDFCAALEESGFEVVSKDVTPEGDLINNIVHFRKPAPHEEFAND